MERNKHYFFNVASGFSHCASSCKMKKKKQPKKMRCCNSTRRGNFSVVFILDMYIYLCIMCVNVRELICAYAHLLVIHSWAFLFSVHSFLLCSFHTVAVVAAAAAAIIWFLLAVLLNCTLSIVVCFCLKCFWFQT